MRSGGTSNMFSCDYLRGGFPIHSREQECIEECIKSMHLKPGGRLYNFILIKPVPIGEIKKTKSPKTDAKIKKH